MEEYEKLTASSKEKSGLDLIAETQKIREQKGNRRKRKNRRWEHLRERGVSGIDTLPGGGLVSGKGMTFRPVDGDTDVFDDINKARRRARQLGCIGVARRMSRSGRRVWTPCTNMTDYARATGSTALGRRYQARLERQRIRGIVQEELSRAKRSGRRRKTRLIEELYDIKGLGRSLRRGATMFDPKAWDGDGDGLVQEGTPFERPSIPGINTNFPGELKTRTKPKDYPADTQRDRKRRADAKKPRRDPNRYRPGNRVVQRRRVERAGHRRRSAGLRSQRLTRSDLNERRERTPEENLGELGEAIDEYVGFLEEHRRHDFIRADADTISAIDASDPGLVNEHDRLKSRVDDLGGIFEEARADLEEMDFERDELQSELNKLVRRFDKANGEFLGNQSTSQRQRRTIIRAVRDGEDRDKFLQSEFPDEMADDQGQMEWLWDTVVEERAEIMQMSKELKELEDRIGKETLGSEATLKLLRELVEGKLDEWGPKPDAPTALGPSNVALNPNTGMRSRRDALSESNKEWLATLQANPGLWDEAPAAVRNVSSNQLRQEAMNLRSSSIQNTGGMRSGGRQKGLEILGKVKPEHKNKPSGERTLFFIGGTTGSGKSTIIKDKKVQLPDATEAAHIDPDDIKTGLRGWDPQNPGNVHHESRRVTDRVMDDAMNGGMDVVVQGTGKRDEHLREAKRRGYQTVGHFVYVPDKEADRRIAQRTADGGPNIPTYFGSLIGGELRNGIVSRQITQGLYDEFYLWDNTGREPRLIAYRNQAGQFAIHGREEFNDFFGSSGKHVESYWQKNK